jgi:hypothetical protein
LKRTRKWAFVKQEAVRLADLGLDPKEIAARLGPGVNRSTVQRWMAAGKIRDTRRGAKGGKLPAFSKDVKPGEWAKTVRKDYALDATDEQLVELAEMMLTVKNDPLQPMTTRIAAAREFRAIAKQLNLVTRTADSKATPSPAAQPDVPKRPMRASRRPSTDPRKVLMMPAAAK